LYNIVCPCWFWPRYCLTFFYVFCTTLFSLLVLAMVAKQIEERQTIPWPKPTRTNNVIQNTSKNVRQYRGQNQQGQTMLYEIHRRKSDNTMAKTNKDKWYCLTFFHVFCITLFVFVGFDHGIV
jgi:hypothetical protein